ncbi:predicted protein [Nematostella vectensis]|uniref:Beta-galactosidase n=1 Tax=Nematostella vectensis TaxID=45351 RepID=A7S8R3_NEMVE|nr:beta-galactosidase isoform X2 [Nematostella vectensis]XP_048582384.1 beta-galactosidase isoform X1 [Nematostella vectensis]EDO39870.1 predicted protein [Nematostella vectensis]|eukprot:XP_001631933.1 predicted protein [Nematostella vectensis]
MAVSYLLLAVSIVFSYINPIAAKSFTIDFDNNRFLKDGQPFRYISGGIHYFRVPQFFWKDRLLKMKAAGMNAIQTYVPWNLHEPTPGKYNFDGGADLLSFLELAHSLDLVAIVRAGPYICAEWDFGGLPAWLLKNSSITLRSSKDQAYMSAVDSWMGVLLPKLKAYLYEHGGPVIMVQVENEYGNYYTCDHEYMNHLEITFRQHLGSNVILFTTDPPIPYNLKCGTLLSLFTTIDFGPGIDPAAAFNIQRQFQPKGPFVNSEYYTGWLDHWGEQHQTKTSESVSQYLDKILALNASVNLYMFEGGTNFGFWNGANANAGASSFQPVPTSYDYDAPLTEAGDPTEKYFAIREVVGKHASLPDIPIPPATPKYSYGTVEMKRGARMIDILSELTPGGPYKSKYPQTMEELDQYSGFVLYRSQIPSMFTQSTRMLNVEGLVRDRAIVYVGSIRQRTLNRTKGESNATIVISEFLELDILVENMGHIGYGSEMVDPKGLVGNVTIDNVQILNWEMYPLNLDNAVKNHKMQSLLASALPGTDNAISPTFYTGVIPAAPFGDTGFDCYLRLDGWSKGVVFINGFNLGRYWPVVGPQKTLYVPASVLSADQKQSSLVILELDDSPCDYPETCLVSFVTDPVVNGTTSPIFRPPFKDTIP